MRCAFCGEEIGDKARFGGFYQNDVTAPELSPDRQVATKAEEGQSKRDTPGASSSNPVEYADVGDPFRWVPYLLNHVLLVVFLLMISHYVMIFLVSLPPIAINVVYMAIAFPFGYDLFARTNVGLGIVLVLGLLVGMLAVTGMSTVLAVILDEPFLGSARARQDLAETTVAIMLAYVAGSAFANFLQQVLPAPSHDHNSPGGIIKDVITFAAGMESGRLADRVQSTTRIVRALIALIVAVGALIIAVKGLFND
jgi:hypothetical protein